MGLVKHFLIPVPFMPFMRHIILAHDKVWKPLPEQMTPIKPASDFQKGSHDFQEWILSVLVQPSGGWQLYLGVFSHMEEQECLRRTRQICDQDGGTPHTL
jgi:hypothetical protein